MCAISSWDGSVVANARVQERVRPLPNCFQMRESFRGWTLQLEWRMRAAFAAAMQGDDDYYLSLNDDVWQYMLVPLTP
jgi:hypothetical protein